MLNPWVLLGIGVAWIVSILGADHFGYTRATNAANAAAKIALDEKLAEWRENTVVDMQAAIEADRRNRAAAAAAQSNKGDFQNAIATNPPDPVCRMDPRRFGLLLDAVDLANGTAPAGGSMPPSVRDPSEAVKPGSGDGRDLDPGRRRPVRPLPASASGLPGVGDSPGLT